MTRDVVLVPGLWMPAAAMEILAARLARAGFRTHVFAYSGRSPFDANLERLARHARERGEGAMHFLGHSLGGTVVLEMLARHPAVAAQSVLLVGAPVRGCFAGRRFAGWPLGRWMMGASESRWSAREACWRRAEPLGVIAGGAPLGLGRLLGRLPGRSDGVVLVEETRVDGMREHTVVNCGHSMLIFSARVARMAARFFERGSFA